MQFTPQQLAGGSSYMCKTKVGNWLEDMCLQEEKLSEFARNRDEGSSLMSTSWEKKPLPHEGAPRSRVVRPSGSVMLSCWDTLYGGYWVVI